MQCHSSVRGCPETYFSRQYFVLAIVVRASSAAYCVSESAAGSIGLAAEGSIFGTDSSIRGRGKDPGELFYPGCLVVGIGDLVRLTPDIRLAITFVGKSDRCSALEKARYTRQSGANTPQKSRDRGYWGRGRAGKVDAGGYRHCPDSRLKEAQ